MEKSKTIEILKDLANRTDGRSETARLADIIEEVERALKAGVKRQAVLEALHNHYGFKMSMSGFEKALRKLRNKNGVGRESIDNKKGIDKKNNYPVPEKVNALNQLAPYIDRENKNTQLVTVPSSIQPIDVDLYNDEEESWEPKTGELEFRKNVKKGLDVQELNAMEEKFKKEDREKKKREREQAKLKNQSTY